MRRFNLALLGLIALLVVAMVAVPAFSQRRAARKALVAPEGIPSTIFLTKIYDVYYVDCEYLGCVEGKCLWSASQACTHLKVCGLQFSQPYTNYDIYLRKWRCSGDTSDCLGDCRWVWEPIPVGSNGHPTGIDKLADSLGRVKYELQIVTNNPGTARSYLTGATLCLGATFCCGPHGQELIGSEYEQEHFDLGATVNGNVQEIYLPVGASADNPIGANVYLCYPPNCGNAVNADCPEPRP
jgi:hypothetical protein